MIAWIAQSVAYLALISSRYLCQAGLILASGASKISTISETLTKIVPAVACTYGCGGFTGFLPAERRHLHWLSPTTSQSEVEDQLQHTNAMLKTYIPV